MTYDEQIEVIVADLRAKLYRRDWHGVMDCAADIRELESAKRAYASCKDSQTPQSEVPLLLDPDPTVRTADTHSHLRDGMGRLRCAVVEPPSVSAVEPKCERIQGCWLVAGHEGNCD